MVFAVCAVVSTFTVVVFVVVVFVVVDRVVVVVIILLVVVVVAEVVFVVILFVVVDVVIVVVVVDAVVVIVVVSIVVDIIGESLKMVKLLGIFLNFTFSSTLTLSLAFSRSIVFFLSPTVSFFMLTLNQGCGLPERFGSFLLVGGFSILRLLSEASLTCSEKVCFSLVPGI